MGNWKAVRPSLDKPIELYDLSNDEGEKHDVASAHKDMIAKVESLLKTVRTESAEYPMRRS